jgi:signal transduction histidine kinase
MKPLFSRENGSKRSSAAAKDAEIDVRFPDIPRGDERILLADNKVRLIQWDKEVLEQSLAETSGRPWTDRFNSLSSRHKDQKRRYPMPIDEKDKGHLLVVDDEPEVPRSIRRLFRKTYAVHTAASAGEALKIMETEPVDVVLSDQRMPETTGVELLGEIRRRFPLALRLIITAYTDIDSVIAAVNDAHIFRYIKKPWDPERLTAAVNDAFRVHDELVRRRDLLENLQERFGDLEVRVTEKTEKLLSANEALKAVYEERDALIRSLEEEIRTRKAMEARLRQAQKLEAIGTLAGGIAHDFNNLLYPIIGFTEMAMDDLPPGSPVRENLDEVLTAADRAANLVRQILHFSRQRSARPSPVDAAPILEDVLALIRADGVPNIQVEREIDPDCGPVMTDPDHLRLVFMNLCNNALQAMGKAGGTLAAACRETEFAPDDPRPPDLAPGRYLRIVVSDTGPGIGEEIMEKIFDPYFTTRSLEGCSGLGLSVALGIIQKTGGAIEVAGGSGEGVAFRVYLPLAAEGRPASPDRAVSPFPRRK